MVDFITNTVNIYVFILGCIGIYVIYTWHRDERLTTQGQFFLLSIALLGFDMPVRAGYYAMAGLLANDGEQYNAYMSQHALWIVVFVAVIGSWGAFRIIRQVEGQDIKYALKMCAASVTVAIFVSIVLHLIFQW